jgi:PEP-CTERM motif
MKTTIVLATLVASLLTGRAQGTFSSSLSPIVPTPDNSWVKATGEFSLDGVSTGFMITFGLEGVIPTTARLVGASSDFMFDLGSPHIAVHSPGPWPDGYDGATSFYGSFSLPDPLRDDFLAGRTTLLLTGSFLGDYQGTVLPVPEPSSVLLFASGVAALLCFCWTRFQR